MDNKITSRKHIEILCRKSRILGRDGLTDRREIDALDVWLHLSDFDKIVPKHPPPSKTLIDSSVATNKVQFCLSSGLEASEIFANRRFGVHLFRPQRYEISLSV